MKKLLITAIAAAGMAFGLRADTLLSGSDFEDGEVPSMGWTLPEDAGRELKNVVETYSYDGDYPDEFLSSAHDKYLSVKTTFGKPISMDLGTAQSIADGAYLDTMVKFTACDPDDAPASTAYADAKIIVWLQTGSGADEDKTYLMIRANGADCATARDFNCGVFTGADAWHRLTIKSIANIKMSGDAVPGFVVFVDEDAVKYTGDKMEITGLEPVAAEYNEAKKLFPSLVQGQGANVETISAVAFDGQGCLDDLALTSAKPSFIVEPDPTLATVTINGTPTNCKDATAVNTALAGLAANQTATIALAYGLDFTNVEGLNIPAVAATVVLDLNGQTITAKEKNEDDPYAITVGAGCALTIIDSSTDKTGKVAGDVNADGAVSIEAGTFDGIVGLWADKASNWIKGGRFLVSGNEGLVDMATFERGKMLALDPDDNAYYVVSEAPTYDFTMTTVEHATPQYMANGAEEWTTWTEAVKLYSGDVVTWKYVPAAGYRAISGNTGTETIADADVTVGTAVVLKHVGQGTEADPYDIADVNDLKWVAEFVNTPNDTTGVYFKQSADITWTPADGAFAGIGVYGDANKTFKGVYDGDNHFIKNIVLTPAKYSGVFQQVTGGTIKNVTVDTVTFSETITYGVHAGVATDGKTYGVFDSEIGGAMVIGCIDGGSVLNVTTKGSFGSTDQPTTGSAGGIICRTKGTVTVDSCVNEADLYGAAAKIAGIVVITQAGTLTIKDCANSGDITYVEKGMNTPSEGAWLIDTKGGYAGIIAYTSATTAITDCSNTGKISTVPAGCAVGQILAGLRDGTTTATGCSGTDDQLAISVGTVNNLMFATVDGDVATYVAPAAGGSYLVTGKGAAFELAAADAKITLDETLANATVTVAAALAGEYEVDHQGNVYSLKKKGGWNPDADPTVPATDVPGLPDSLKGVSLKQLSTWAVDKGVDFADASKIIPEAFLLNCENTQKAVDDAKEEFKFTEFDPANPPTADAFASKGYNGTVQVKSFSDAACTTEASTGDQLFYRAFLVPTPASVED